MRVPLKNGCESSYVVIASISKNDSKHALRAGTCSNYTTRALFRVREGGEFPESSPAPALSHSPPEAAAPNPFTCALTQKMTLINDE